MKSFPIHRTTLFGTGIRNRALLGVGLIVSLLAVLFISMDQSVVTRFVTERLIASLRPYGIQATIQEPEFHLTSYAARELNVFLPKTFLTFAVTSPRISTSLWNLLTLNYQASFLGQPYGGEVAAHVGGSIFGGPLMVQGDLRDLDLSLHPQLQLLGISKGKISVHVEGLKIDGPIAREGKISLRMVDGERQQTGILQSPLLRSLPALTGIPLEMIPSITGIYLQGEVSFQPNVITIPPMKFTCSFGSLSGGGKIDRDIRTARIQDISLRFQVRLSDEGARLLGPFLPLVSRGGLRQGTKEFTINTSGELPNITYTALRN